MKLAAAVLILLLVPAVLAGPSHPSSDERSSLATDREAYAWPLSPLVDPVCFTFTNTGSEPVFLPSSAPWSIVDAEERPVFAPGAFDVIVPVEPGASFSDCWQDAWIVAPGQHYVVLHYFHDREAWTPATLQAGFVLSAAPLF